MIGNKLKELRNKNKLTLEELANRLNNKYPDTINFNKGKLSKWENGKEEPKLSSLRLVADFYKVSIDSFVDSEQSDITTIYNQLNEKRQKKVYNYAEKQLEKQNKVIDVDFVKEDLSEVYVAYDVSAGVGYGNDYELTDYDIEYTNERLRNYDFAFRINGDSMEPDLVTGDVALVQRTESVDNGSIYVVSYSDSLYVKEVRIEDDVFILHSLNPKYQDIPIDLVDNDEPPRIIGKVVDSFTPLQVN